MKGYTLVELLVVIALIAIVGAVAVANFANFQKDQQLLSGASNLKSFLRVAQSNAEARLNCGSSSGANWFLEIKTDRLSFDLKCQVPPQASVFQKTFTLPTDIEVDSIAGSCASTFPTNVITVSFAPLLGTVSFTDPGALCISTSPTLNFTLKNTKTGNTKAVIIDKGGSIDVQ